MASKRQQDANGFTTIKDCPLSSFGIFDYSAAQLGLDGDPNRIVKVFRPESAVSDPEFIESLKNVPFIDEHEMLSGFEDDEDATAPEDKGVDGVLTSEVYYASSWLRGDLKIFTRRLKKALDSGKQDLSLGYACKFRVESGVFNGEAYEVVQDTMRGNHIALVGRGRVPGARVLDGMCFDSLDFSIVTSIKGSELMNKKAFDNALETLIQALPALKTFLEQEQKEPEHKEGAEGGAAAANTEATADVDTGAATGNEGEQAAVAAAEPGAEQAQPEAAAEGNPLEGVKAALEALLNQISAMSEGGGNGAVVGQDNDDNKGTAADVAGIQPELKVQAGKADEPGKTDNPKTSAGPKAGENAMAEDSAIRGFYTDLAAKDSLYQRASKVIGAFDHKGMDSAALANYCVGKLKINAPKGFEKTALDAYLTGVESSQKTAQVSAKAKNAQDSAGASEVDNYLKGTK